MDFFVKRLPSIPQVHVLSDTIRFALLAVALPILSPAQTANLTNHRTSDTFTDTTYSATKFIGVAQYSSSVIYVGTDTGDVLSIDPTSLDGTFDVTTGASNVQFMTGSITDSSRVVISLSTGPGVFDVIVSTGGSTNSYLTGLATNLGAFVAPDASGNGFFSNHNTGQIFKYTSMGASVTDFTTTGAIGLLTTALGGMSYVSNPSGTGLVVFDTTGKGVFLNTNGQVVGSSIQLSVDSGFSLAGTSIYGNTLTTTAWSSDAGVDSIATYTFDATGVNFSAIPEPSDYAAIFGLGSLVAGVVWKRRRR
jgi:hypothetical protein